jgi:hypothetical protein
MIKKVLIFLLVFVSLCSCGENEYLIKCNLTEIDTNPHQEFSFIFTYNNESKVVTQYSLVVGQDHDYQGWESWFQLSPSSTYPFTYSRTIENPNYTLAVTPCDQNEYCSTDPKLDTILVLFLRNLDEMIKKEEFDELFGFKIGYADEILDYATVLTNTDEDFAKGSGCRLIKIY